MVAEQQDVLWGTAPGGSIVGSGKEAMKVLEYQAEKFGLNCNSMSLFIFFNLFSYCPI